MLWIAAALLVAIPIAFALADGPSVSGGEIANFALDAAATITDIVLVEPPTRYDRAATHNMPEQLVEGHTVFATIEIPLFPNVTNFTIDIVGNVSCALHSDAEGEFFAGIIPIPRRVNEAHVECHAAGRVFATPDPFIDSDDQQIISSNFQPNGRTIPFTAPDGQTGEAQEYAWTVVTQDWVGQTHTHHLYAWSVPVLEPWTHSDGRPKNFYVPIPEDRLFEMGIEDFTAYHESELEGLPQA